MAELFRLVNYDNLPMFCGFSSELKPGSRTKPTKSMGKLDIFLTQIEHLRLGAQHLDPRYVDVSENGYTLIINQWEIFRILSHGGFLQRTHISGHMNCGEKNPEKLTIEPGWTRAQGMVSLSFCHKKTGYVASRNTVSPPPPTGVFVGSNLPCTMAIWKTGKNSGKMSWVWWTWMNWRFKHV